MKGRTMFAGIVLATALTVLGYLLATGKPFTHEIIYLAVLAGFVVSDRSFWPDRKS